MNNKITIKPYAPNIGAIITGIDLSKKISNSVVQKPECEKAGIYYYEFKDII